MIKGVLAEHLQCGCHEVCGGHEAQLSNKTKYLVTVIVILGIFILALLWSLTWVLTQMVGIVGLVQ